MTEIPEGYRENAQGHLVPEDSIAEIDAMRDELVRELVEEARRVQKILADFKLKSMGDVDSFVQLSGEKYGVQLGGRKGNVTLTSFDGRYQVKIAIADRITFDERIHAAKALVDKCIMAWSKGSRKELRRLVMEAFQADKEGKLNVARILGLTRSDISDDEEWQQAMQAVKDSMQAASTCAYLRLYERDEKGQYQNLSLDIASV